MLNRLVNPPEMNAMVLPAPVAAALRSVSALALCAAVRAQEAPPAPEYRLDPGHTFVHWEVLHMGTSTTRGRFERLDGRIAFDAARRAIDVGIRIDTASVSTGSAAFDQVLRGDALLAVQAHPTAWFVARRATFDGEAPRQVHGELTLRGRSIPLTLTALRWKCGLNLLFRREVCGGDFEARISRAEFEMNLAAGLVADEVRLLVQVEGVRAAPGDGS